MVCTQCGVDNPLTSEYFSKKSSRKSGFKSNCKACDKLYRKKNYIKNKELINKKNREYNEKNKEKMAAKKKLYADAHKEETAVNAKRYYKEHSEKISAYQKKYRELHREKLLLYNKEYVKLNSEKIRARAVESSKKYNSSPSAKKLHAINSQNRRTRKEKLIAYLSISEWEQCVRHFNNSCAYCGTNTENLVQDHFIPLSKGGEYTINNIICSCRSCNAKKHISSFYSWYHKQPFYSKERENKILKYLNYDTKTKSQQLYLLGVV